MRTRLTYFDLAAEIAVPSIRLIPNYESTASCRDCAPVASCQSEFKWARLILPELRRVDPPIYVHPYAAPSFSELSNLAKNSDTSVLRAVHDDEWWKAGLKLFGVNAALNTTAVALEELRPNHAVHSTSHSESRCGY